MKTLLIIILTLVSTTVNADSKQSLTIFAGTGLNHTSFNTTTTTSTYHFQQNGFVMGFEYSHDFMVAPDKGLPIFWNGTFVTNSSFLVGLGIDLSVMRFTGKIGYGLTNTDSNNSGSPYTAANNYGILFGLGSELRITDNFGLSFNYITNNTYLGGVTVHW